MNNFDNKNYIPVTLAFTATVVAVLILMIFIPDFKIGGIDFHRVNILSDVYKPHTNPSTSDTIQSDTSYLSQDSVLSLIEKQFSDTILSVQNDLKRDTAIKPEPIVWKVKTESSDSATRNLPGADSLLRTTLPDSMYVPIEDFTADGRGLKNFFAKLDSISQMDRPIRVVFLGDSFIEGDIFTIDVREKLQDVFGGGGVGYMPMQSQVSAMRMSVKHSCSDMETLSLVNVTDVDSLYVKSFSLSGQIFIPKEGASVSFSGVKSKRHLKNFSTARLLFVNRDSTEITITVNDSIVRSFAPPSNSKIQQIVVADNIKNIKFEFSKVGRFICYGAYLENPQGVSVDNQSLRGSSGIQLLASNIRVSREINEMSQCDLVVLQYGLNIMTEEQTNYDGYTQKMTSAVRVIKRNFPNADILIMGVPDRNVLKEGVFVTMSTMQTMIAAQRQIAKNTETLFWNTFQAMGGENSMSEFVDRGWGAKDYTHINYRGGRYIADAFVKALLWGKQNKYSEIQCKVDTTSINQVAQME